MSGLDTTKFAKQLRKDSTDAERLLWSKLRAKQLAGIKFRRQEPFRQYVLDFVSYEKRLVIELDGGQHGKDEQIFHDADRTVLLNDQGFTVLRFWNNDVLSNIEGVLERILEYCGTASPSPQPPPIKGGGAKSNRFPR